MLSFNGRWISIHRKSIWTIRVINECYSRDCPQPNLIIFDFFSFHPIPAKIGLSRYAKEIPFDSCKIKVKTELKKYCN